LSSVSPCHHPLGWRPGRRASAMMAARIAPNAASGVHHGKPRGATSVNENSAASETSVSTIGIAGGATLQRCDAQGESQFAVDDVADVASAGGAIDAPPVHGGAGRVHADIPRLAACQQR